MVQLYDFRNRPIDMASLSREAKPRYGIGRSTGWQNITDGTEVSPTWISGAIRQMERGDVRNFVKLVERMKERFNPFSSAIGELTDGLGGQYRVTAASSTREDMEIADTVKRVVESHAFQLHLVHIRDALPMGWSTGEMQWADDTKGKHVPQTFVKVPADAIKFADDGCTPMILAPGWRYEPLQWGKFISHVSMLRSGLPVNVGMAKSCSYLYLFESFAWAAWSGHLERFGSPIIKGTHRKGADPEEIAALENAISTLVANGSLVHEEGMAIDVMEHVAASAGGNGTAYRDLIIAAGKQVRVAVLGVDMTDTGSGSRALGEVLERKVQSRKRTIGFQEEATLSRDIVRAIVTVNYPRGAIRPAPRLYLDHEGEADMKVLAEGVGPLIDRGLQVRVAEVLDRAGLPIPEGMDPNLLMFPIRSKASPQDVADVKDAQARAAGALVAEAKAQERAEEYSRAILRIMSVADEPLVRKRELVARQRAIAKEFGFDVASDDAAA